jgi:zinc protease
MWVGRPSEFPPKDRAPVQPVLPVASFPVHTRGCLPSGLTWMAVPRPDVDLVELAWVVEGGWRSDVPRRGIPELLGRCMPEGTVERSVHQIAFDLERWGAYLRVDVDEDAMTFRLTSLASTWAEAFRVFLDVLLQPTFPGPAVRREALRWRQQIEASRADPEFLARERMRASLFGDHPYGRVVPPAEALETIHRWDLLTGYAERMDLTRSALIIVGAVDPEAVLRVVEAATAGWPLRARWSEPSGPTPASDGRGHWVLRSPSVQTEIWVGVPVGPVGTPDWLPGLVLSTILGGGASGRLFLRLREEKGYTYGAYSRHQRFLRGGWWVVSTQVRKDVTREALREVVRSLEDLPERPPTREEIESALRYVIGRFAIHHQTLPAIAQRLRDLFIYRLPDDFWRAYTDMLTAVTPTAVAEAGLVWRSPWHVVCVGEGPDGPPPAAWDFLEPHVGTWHVWDVQGRPLGEG